MRTTRVRLVARDSFAPLGLRWTQCRCAPPAHTALPRRRQSWIVRLFSTPPQARLPARRAQKMKSPQCTSQRVFPVLWGSTGMWTWKCVSHVPKTISTAGVEALVKPALPTQFQTRRDLRAPPVLEVLFGTQPCCAVICAPATVSAAEVEVTAQHAESAS